MSWNLDATLSFQSFGLLYCIAPPSDLDGLIKAIERRIRETKTSNGTIQYIEKIL